MYTHRESNLFTIYRFELEDEELEIKIGLEKLSKFSFFLQKTFFLQKPEIILPRARKAYHFWTTALKHYMTHSHEPGL